MHIESIVTLRIFTIHTAASTDLGLHLGSSEFTVQAELDRSGRGHQSAALQGIGHLIPDQNHGSHTLSWQGRVIRHPARVEVTPDLPDHHVAPNGHTKELGQQNQTNQVELHGSVFIAWTINTDITAASSSIGSASTSLQAIQKHRLHDIIFM